MSLGRQDKPVAWDHLAAPEKVTLYALAVEPQSYVMWSIKRSLCFYGFAEITSEGLRLTRLGRSMLASRHGLPTVIGLSSSHRSFTQLPD
jgi:hypothetical protein